MAESVAEALAQLVGRWVMVVGSTVVDRDIACVAMVDPVAGWALFDTWDGRRIMLATRAILQVNEVTAEQAARCEAKRAASLSARRAEVWQ